MVSNPFMNSNRTYTISRHDIIFKWLSDQNNTPVDVKTWFGITHLQTVVSSQSLTFISSKRGIFPEKQQKTWDSHKNSRHIMTALWNLVIRGNYLHQTWSRNLNERQDMDNLKCLKDSTMSKPQMILRIINHTHDCFHWLAPRTYRDKIVRHYNDSFSMQTKIVECTSHHTPAKP